jgi:hypothetical protein
MRQGGMKPKNHNSGVYWVRATSDTNSSKVEEENLSTYILCWILVLPLFIIFYPFIWLREKFSKS